MLCLLQRAQWKKSRLTVDGVYISNARITNIDTVYYIVHCIYMFYY